MQWIASSLSRFSSAPTSSRMSSLESAFSCSGLLSRTTAHRFVPLDRDTHFFSRNFSIAARGSSVAMERASQSRAWLIVWCHARSARSSSAGARSGSSAGASAQGSRRAGRPRRRARPRGRTGLRAPTPRPSSPESPRREDDLSRARRSPTMIRKPLSRAARGNRAVLGPDVTDERVVDHDRKITGHLQLVAAANADAVDARKSRLPTSRRRSCASLNAPTTSSTRRACPGNPRATTSGRRRRRRPAPRLLGLRL